MSTAKKEILDRIRSANKLAGIDNKPYPIPRDYEVNRTKPADELIDLLVDRLEDYKAHVEVISADDLPSTVARHCKEQKVELLGAAEGIDSSVVSKVEAKVETDDRSTDPRDLDRFDAIVTSSHVTSAQTGTIFLDGSKSNGRRALTLVPDCHICLVPQETIVYGVPEAVDRLNPNHPITLVSGPSATSDIELNRVEGVHGPRRLIVLIVKK